MTHELSVATEVDIWTNKHTGKSVMITGVESVEGNTIFLLDDGTRWNLVEFLSIYVGRRVDRRDSSDTDI